jgi:cytochrome P450
LELSRAVNLSDGSSHTLLSDRLASSRRGLAAPGRTVTALRRGGGEEHQMSESVEEARPKIPPHVDPAHVVDFNVFRDHRLKSDEPPHAAFLRLKAENDHGMLWTPHNGGHWIIANHELLFDAVRNPGLFSSTAMTIPPMPPELEPRLLPLFSDPPLHGLYRLPLMRAFAPARIQAMEAAIRAFAIELVEAVSDQNGFDFFAKIAVPLPVVIFMKLMGMDLSRLAEFRGWTLEFLSDDDMTRVNAHRKVGEMMKPLIEARQAKREQDLISWLLDSDIDGRAPTFDELQAYCLLLFAAGLDTVANSLGFGMAHLASEPALQDRLRSEPALIPEAVEELLRLYAVAMPGRTVARDAEFGGVRLRAGERVMLMIPGANLDPAAFPEPERFDLDREHKAHMSFNSGPHRCVGSHLARLEMRVFYEEWFRRMPNVRLNPDAPPAFRSSLILAVERLPLVVERDGEAPLPA